MPRAKTKDSSPRPYNRRTEEQRIADLEAKIQTLKARSAAKATQKDPVRCNETSTALT
jgi:hypothetical protein